MEAAEIRRKHKEFLFPIVNNYYEEPLVPAKASGLVVTDVDGRDYLDFFGGIVTVSVGHGHPKVVEATVAQLRTLVHLSTLYPNEPQVRLAEKLAQIAPFRPAKSFFVNSGTEADEAAVMLAKVATGRRDVVALRHGYAGRSALAVNLMGQAPWRVLDSELPIKHAHAPYCYRCDFHLKYPDCGLACAKDVKTLVQTETRGQIAAMIAEPVLGVGGIVVPPREYFAEVAGIVREAGGLFIADEVQTAWGRTGTWWGSQHFPGFEPDIVTSAKGLANGLPIGVVLAKASVADAWRGLSLSTFGGNPVSATAALATLGVVEEDALMQRARDGGRRLRDGLEQLQRDFPGRIGDVRGLGLLQGVELVREAASKEPDPAAVLRMLEATKRRGLLVGKGGLFGNVLRVTPPLVATDRQIDDALRILAESLREALAV